MMMKPTDDLRPELKRNWDWSTEREFEALSYLRNYLFKLALRDSSKVEDTKQATDYVIESPAKLKIAIRLRRISNTRNKRDFTLRLSLPSGAKTEVAKLKESPVDWYCYAWFDDVGGDGLVEYAIIDVKRFVQLPIFGSPDGEIWTNDKSAQFAFWRLDNVWAAGCVVEGVKYPGRAVSYRYSDNWMLSGATQSPRLQSAVPSVQ